MIRWIGGHIVIVYVVMCVAYSTAGIVKKDKDNIFKSPASSVS